MNVALIFAGGVGKRMKTNGLPKQFLKVQGMPVIIHTLNKFQQNDNIDKIIVVSVESHLNYMRELVKQYQISKVENIVSGGDTPQKSIYYGLKEIKNIDGVNDDCIVLIHDGVRPLINDELINLNIDSVEKFGSAISSVKEKETIVIANDNVITEITEKKNTYIARAPQSFYYKDIMKYHEMALNDKLYEFIDCCSMMLHFGENPHIIECSSQNIKITTPDDYYIFKAILEIEENRSILGL